MTAVPSGSILPDDIARHFRDVLRDARATAQRDAEGFMDVLFALERIGEYLAPGASGLAAFRGAFSTLLSGAPLREAIASDNSRLLAPFDALYEVVRDARNLALHHGAFARHLTARCTELALLLEDGLTSHMHTVGDFMVHSPVVASGWHPLSFVRHTMLANSFSFLPVWLGASGIEGWRLISDYRLASYLRASQNKTDRQRRLSRTVDDVVTSSELLLDESFVCTPDTAVHQALASSRGLPILICGSEQSMLVGILSPFDLL